ncbi:MULTISPECIES: ABC transporter substrate-binding protein [unclassified Aureimonas]|uniref:ABC transporter substrate-binding protein n=1 Tax=unclassified Aureimonas TaxID=2615206 RepID=UPI0006F215BC|nr:MULTISPECIES: ABC transporter substrate-binding protein [unclassified Aureimonas]KQT64382.1 ABC transporter substrate-binding protein [Aureimonas sp. Leaf427]KQT81573.1 ABC transporter substrate-binding protein [Aureimonas sp. Leaf460]
MPSLVSRSLPVLALALALGFSAGASAEGLKVDLRPEQPDRIRAEPVQAAIDLLPKDYAFVTPGTFTVATNPGNLPFSVYATDTKTPVGGEPDLAQLVADSLGLKLEVVAVAWPDWPLGLTSGKYDAAITNITVTEARKEKFDFSTYRADLLGFYVPNDSKIQSIARPEDVAGLKVAVSSGTNQEEILLRWSKENEKKGLKPTDISYYDDEAVQDLALQSGRIDAYFGPNSTSAFKAARVGKTRLVGTFSGGWPETAEIAVTTKKGAGLADAITAAINAQIANGNYAKTLARWNLSAEAVKESRTNPAGLPKS